MLNLTITILQRPPEHVSNGIKPGQQCGPPNGVGKLPEVSHNTATLNEITYVSPVARGGAGGQVHPPFF